MSATFSVSGGQILDPNGQPFVARGINTGTIGINGRAETISIMNTMASQLTSTFPGVNMVRVPIWQNAINQGLTPADLAPAVKALNAAGVVVEFEYHDYPTTLSGGALTSVANFYSGLATTFNGNPNVWFGSQNEPGGGPIDTEISTLYNAVRAAGNNTIFMMCMNGGYTTNGLNPATYTSMHNVVWDTHFYSWEPGGMYGLDPTNPAQSAQALANNLKSITNFTHSADGTIPIIIGEYGPAAGNAMDNGGYQTVASVEQSGVGSLAWAWDTFNSGNPIPGDLVNPPWSGGQSNLTNWGQTLENWLATSSGPSAFVTGNGSDSLVLLISEDAYQGNAQFTVAVDGKQLGGTFAATGSHATAQEQSFTFKGDWAPGTHSVTVTYLNDLSGGTATTNRNLYVDKITYNGVAASQKLALTTNGPQSVSVVDTTALPPPPSPDGTKITTAAGAPIIDQAGNRWTLVQSAANGLQIAVNGTVDPVTTNVVLLESLGGKIVQENSASTWYSETAPGAGWTQIAAPIAPPPPPPPPVPSPDGTKITTAAGAPIIDQAGNRWTLVQSAANGLQIAVNGTVDPVTTNVVLLESLGGKIVQENSASTWYSETAPGAGWTQIASPIAPPPPPPPVPSPDGTKITTAAGAPIIDQAGNRWTLVQSAANGLQIAVNGTVDPVTTNVVLLESLGGKIVQENRATNWYSETAPGAGWTHIASPIAPPPPPPPPVPSPDGTKITTAAGAPIIDQAGNRWTLVQSAANGLQIAVNGTVDPVTTNVVLLESLGGKIVQENSATNWYSETAPGAGWTQIASPVAPPPPPPVATPVTTGSGSDTLVLGMSEDAYQGDAQFTVAVDGKQLAGTFTALASHAAGASQNFTFLGDWAPGAHTVAVNFLTDAYGGSTAADRNLYVNAVSYDTAATGQSAMLAAAGATSFSVTDATAVPSAATGSGSDTLVLGMSEDAYQGDAQFTVAVDGKQLGGTFATTASHAAGVTQNFTFKGDFGTGAHAVAVNFLNDAYGGSAAADRNLYVNAITYGGANTAQSAMLAGVGAKAFTVTGGTTPALSETGDHGSLAKNLSQTGTYTVGGDTFVLSAGDAAAATLGTGTSQIRFIGASAVTLTAGSGQATVTADAGNNRFTAGTGTLDVTGGGGKDAYVFHANGGLLRLEDFSIAKGDTLTVDKALQGAMAQTSDGQGGTMLSFGGAAGHGVDIHGLAAMPATNIVWA